MHVDENWEAGCLSRLIEAKRDRTMRAWNLALRQMKHRFRFPCKLRDLMITESCSSDLFCTAQWLMGQWFLGSRCRKLFKKHFCCGSSRSSMYFLQSVCGVLLVPRQTH